LRIANFVGLSGPSGIWGPASINSTLLGVSEINRRGGILGREIEVAFHDTGGDIDDGTQTAPTSSRLRRRPRDGLAYQRGQVALRKVVAGTFPISTAGLRGRRADTRCHGIGETPGRNPVDRVARQPGRRRTSI
jgi:hypothetical protein